METSGATLTAPPMAQLARKMANIMGQLQRLNQDSLHPQGWTFTDINDITDAIRPLMAEHGVALFSKMLKSTQTKEGKTTLATVDMEFELVCADSGASKVMSWTSSAEDYSDKAVNKAAVFAEKSWLKSTFLVSTRKNAGATSPGANKRNEQPRQQQRQEPPRQAQTNGNHQVDRNTGEVLGNGSSTPAHWSDDVTNQQLLVNRAIENLYLDLGATWDNLLTYAGMDSESVRKVASGEAMGGLVKEKAKALIQQKVDQRKQDELPKRFRHCVTDATFNAKTEEITFMVPTEATKDAAQIKPLIVKRSKFLAMLTTGDKGQEANGKKHAEAMCLDAWTTGSTLSGEVSSHSFPEIILDYTTKGTNGSMMLWLVTVTPANDLRGETLPQPTSATGKALAASAGSIVADLDAQLAAAKELDPDYIPF